MPIAEVMIFENATPASIPTALPMPETRSASVRNSLKISRPGAPIAILTPTSRTRSLSDAIWMLTLTMPPPRMERTPDSAKITS